MKKLRVDRFLQVNFIFVVKAQNDPMVHTMGGLEWPILVMESTFAGCRCQSKCFVHSFREPELSCSKTKASGWRPRLGSHSAAAENLALQTPKAAATTNATNIRELCSHQTLQAPTEIADKPKCLTYQLQGLNHQDAMWPVEELRGWWPSRC